MRELECLILEPRPNFSVVCSHCFELLGQRDSLHFRGNGFLKFLLTGRLNTAILKAFTALVATFRFFHGLGVV